MMYRTYSKGTIEVITGPMFSGKTEELIKRIHILKYAKKKTLIVKPSIDTRWDKFKMTSRSGATIHTIACENTQDIWKEFKKDNFEVVAIDEVQFFEKDIVVLIKDLAHKGVRVIISGLDQDFSGNPFKSMPQILAIADIVDKQSAVCNVCGNAATMTFRLTNDQKQVAIGDKEYEPRCRKCHHEGLINK